MYADVLTRLANFFPVEELPSVTYLLEEDASTVGFKPFRDPDLAPECNLYTFELGLKPRMTDPGIERSHPNIEMLARVREILLCGLTLAVNDDYPIALSPDTRVFMFVEEGLPMSSPANGHRSNPAISSPDHPNNNFTVPDTASPQNVDIAPDESVAASDSHHSMDTDMHRMVDSLLEPSNGRSDPSNETSYGMHSLTANEVFAPVSNSVMQSHFQSTPRIFPSLPGLWNSPFTPKPNELKPTSPERPTTVQQVSPLQLITGQQQHAAAAALDEMTGYTKSNHTSWGRDRQGSGTPSQAVNQILQDSLAQQFMPLSNFSDSSSIYVNTPHAANRYSGGALTGDSYSSVIGNNTTTYAGASDFDKTTMLQSSIWNGSQQAWQGYVQTPPGGQGG